LFASQCVLIEAEAGDIVSFAVLAYVQSMVEEKPAEIGQNISGMWLQIVWVFQPLLRTYQ